VKCGHLDISQGDASTLCSDLGDAHVSWDKGAWAVVGADDQLAFAHQEKRFFSVDCTSQDGASRDVHCPSVQAIAEVVVDRHVHLGQLEQLGL
jgi:hypothetical protein